MNVSSQYRRHSEPKTLLSRGLFVATLFAALLSGLVPRAEAQGDRFRELVTSGLDAYAAEDWSLARSLFEEAHAIRPTAEALRMMGNASFELGDYAAAVNYLDLALAFDLRPLSESAREETLRARDAAAEHVAILRVRIFPEHGTVALDGRTLSPGELASLVLEPGTYHLSVRAEGYIDDERELELGLGETRENIVLLAVGATQPDPEEGDGEDEGGISPWVWVGVVAGVVVAGAGVGLGVYYGTQEPDAFQPPDGVTFIGTIEALHF